MSDDEPTNHGDDEAGARILPFSRRLAQERPKPPTTGTGPTPTQYVDPRDPVSLLASHIDVLRRFSQYAKQTHYMAVQLLSMGSAGPVIANAAAVQEMANTADREALTVEKNIRALEPWLAYLRDPGEGA